MDGSGRLSGSTTLIRACIQQCADDLHDSFCAPIRWQPPVQSTHLGRVQHEPLGVIVQEHPAVHELGVHEEERLEVTLWPKVGAAGK